jgi:hypothetical protein
VRLYYGRPDKSMKKLSACSGVQPANRDQECRYYYSDSFSSLTQADRSATAFTFPLTLPKALGRHDSGLFIDGDKLICRHFGERLALTAGPTDLQVDGRNLAKTKV